MSKAYTEQTATLKTVTHDTTVLDSQKILVYPGEGARSERKDILAIINENDDLIKNEVSALDTRLDDAEADIDELVADVAALESKNYAYTDTPNTFSEENTFEKTVVAQDGMHAMGGDILITNGALTFEDLIDGTVVERSGASGYQYVEGMPTSFNNGVCYDIGEISSTTDLSNVKFTTSIDPITQMARLVQTCEVWFTTPATAPTTHQWPYGNDLYWIDSPTGAAPTLIASKNYRIVLRREPKKVIASIAYLY